MRKGIYRRKKIITIPGVRRCGKSTLMEIAINALAQSGVSPDRILWIGFDDERLKSMKAEELDEVLAAYMEMYPDVPIGEAYLFFDEIQLIENWEYFVLRVYKLYCKNIYVCGSNATMRSTELKSALRGYPLEHKRIPSRFGSIATSRESPRRVSASRMPRGCGRHSRHTTAKALSRKSC